MDTSHQVGFRVVGGLSDREGQKGIREGSTT